MPSIKVDVGMDAKKFFTDASELKRAINSFQTTVKQAGKDMRDSMYGYGTAMQKSVVENKKAQQSMQALKDEAYRLSDAIDEFSNKKIETNQYKELKANIGKAKEEMARLKEQREQMQKSGNSHSEEYKLLAATIGATINKLTKLEDEYKNIMKLQNQMMDMRDSGVDDKGQILSEEQKNSLSAAIDDNQTKLIEYENQMKKLTQIRDKYVTEQNQMRVNGDWMSAPYRKLMEAITLTRRHMRSLIEDKHKMEAQGHNAQFIYGSETEEFEKMEKQEQELIDKFQEMYKVKNKALMPPYLESWKKMVTFSGLINEGFGRIRNAASGAIYAIIHPIQAADRALGFLVQKAGQVVSSLARMAGNAALSFLRNLASTATNAAIKLAQLAGNAVLAGLQRIAIGAKNAAINLAKIAGSAVLGALSKLANAARNTAAEVARIGGNAVKTAINGLVSLAARGTKAILGIGKSSRAANGGLKMSLKTILKYAFGVRSMFFLFRRLRTAVTDGLGAIAKRNPELQKSLNGLTRAFNALKGSLSTAFAPIVTAVAPALTMLINMLTSAINTIGAFLAALTGKTSYQKSIGAIGSSAKSSSKSVKDLNRQLASFDELNILSDKNNSGGGGGSSDGGGFAYENAAIESGIIDFVDELKKLWEKADFEGIGRIIADGINKAIAKARDAISWKTLGDKITSVVNGITGIINGLIDGVDWGNIGETFGEGINTLVNTWNKLFDGIKFVNLGKGLADALNGLVDTVDWDGLGKAFTKKINAIFDTLFGLVTNFKWGEAGKKFATAVSSFANNINWTVIGRTLSEGIKGALEFLTNAIITFDWDSITKNLQNGIMAIDWDGIGKKFSDFANSIFDINWYQIGNTLRMAIDGVLDMLISAVKNFRWGDAGSAFAKAVRGLYSKDTFDRLSTLLGDGINGAMEALTKAVSGFEWGKIGTDFGNAVNKLKDKVDWFKIGSTLNKLLGVALSMMVNAIKTIEWGDAGEKFAKAMNAFFSEDAEYNVWALATETIREMARGLVDFTDKFIVTANWEQIGTDIQNGFRKVPWREIGTAVWGMMEDAFRATGSFLSALTGEKKTVDVNLSYGSWKTEQLKKQAGNVAKSTQSIWNDVADNLTNGFNNAINALTSFIENLPVSNTVTALADWLVRVREGIKWDNLGILFGTGIKKALEGIGGILAKWADGAKAIGGNIGTFLNNAIKKVDWISDSDGSVKMIIQNFFKGAVGMVRGFFDNLDVEALAINLRQTLLGVDWKGIAKDIWDALSSALSKMGDFISVLLGGKAEVDMNYGEWKNAQHSKQSGNNSLAGSVSKLAVNILDAIKYAINNIPWKAIGDEVHDFLVAIEWKDVAQAFWNAITSLLGGLGDFVKRIFGIDTDDDKKGGNKASGGSSAVTGALAVGGGVLGIKAISSIPKTLGAAVKTLFGLGTGGAGGAAGGAATTLSGKIGAAIGNGIKTVTKGIGKFLGANAEFLGTGASIAAPAAVVATVAKGLEDRVLNNWYREIEGTRETINDARDAIDDADMKNLAKSTNDMADALENVRDPGAAIDALSNLNVKDLEGKVDSKTLKRLEQFQKNNELDLGETTELLKDIYDEAKQYIESGGKSSQTTSKTEVYGQWKTNQYLNGNQSVEVNIDTVPDGDKSGNTSQKKLSKAMDGTPVDTSVTYDGSKPGKSSFVPKKNLEKSLEGTQTSVSTSFKKGKDGIQTADKVYTDKEKSVAASTYLKHGTTADGVQLITKIYTADQMRIAAATFLKHGTSVDGKQTAETVYTRGEKLVGASTYLKKGTTADGKQTVTDNYTKADKTVVGSTYLKKGTTVDGKQTVTENYTQKDKLVAGSTYLKKGTTADGTQTAAPLYTPQQVRVAASTFLKHGTIADGNQTAENNYTRYEKLVGGVTYLKKGTTSDGIQQATQVYPRDTMKVSAITSLQKGTTYDGAQTPTGVYTASVMKAAVSTFLKKGSPYGDGPQTADSTYSYADKKISGVIAMKKGSPYSDGPQTAESTYTYNDKKIGGIISMKKGTSWYDGPQTAEETYSYEDKKVEAVDSMVKSSPYDTAENLYSYKDKSVSAPVSLERDGWTTVSGWANSWMGNIAVQVGLNLTESAKKAISAITGTTFASGGAVTKSGNVIQFMRGGEIMRNGKSSWWDSAIKYASGTSRAHGTVFVAGENGPEIMGHVNGRTEILNKSQLAQAIYGAVVSGMAAAVNSLGKYLANHMSTCANAIVSTISANSGLAALSGLQYYAPAMASGGIVPYAVSEQIAKSTEAIQSTLNANNEDLIQTIISVAGQLVSAVSGLQNRQMPGNTMNAQQVINEINRQYMMGLNPIKGV